MSKEDFIFGVRTKVDQINRAAKLSTDQYEALHYEIETMAERLHNQLADLENAGTADCKTEDQTDGQTDGQGEIDCTACNDSECPFRETPCRDDPEVNKSTDALDLSMDLADACTDLRRKYSVGKEEMLEAIRRVEVAYAAVCSVDVSKKEEKDFDVYCVTWH